MVVSVSALIQGILLAGQLVNTGYFISECKKCLVKINTASYIVMTLYCSQATDFSSSDIKISS